jgi:hypothetical protein
MRKFLPYTLIIFILLGFFGITTPLKANASNCICADHVTVGIYPKISEYNAASNALCENACSCDKAGFYSYSNIANIGYRTVESSCDTSKIPTTISPTTPPVNTDTTYTPLAPLPGLEKFDTNTPCSFGGYLNIMIKIFIGFAAVLAMVMVFLGGIQYMTSEVISSKEAGKERIMNAILGLLLALGAYTLLYTINPKLLDSCLNTLPEATIIINSEPEVGIQGKTINVGGTIITACDTSQIAPLTLFGVSVTGGVNKAIVNNLKRIDAKWQAMPEANRYKVNRIEGYDCRPVTNKPGYWSSHAFGLALDINPDTNPYGPTLKTDMPMSFVGLFIVGEGWGWGGGWLNLKDAMHYSKIPPAELGNGNLN